MPPLLHYLEHCDGWEGPACPPKLETVGAFIRLLCVSDHVSGDIEPGAEGAADTHVVAAFVDGGIAPMLARCLHVPEG